MQTVALLYVTYRPGLDVVNAGCEITDGFGTGLTLPPVVLSQAALTARAVSAGRTAWDDTDVLAIVQQQYGSEVVVVEVLPSDVPPE